MAKRFIAPRRSDGRLIMLRSHLARSLALLAVGLLIALPAAAEPRTSSDLLLPYFEVDLGGPQTTLFAVGNAHDQPIQVRASVATNWGIPVLGVTLDLDAGEVLTVNLRDWIEKGELPTQNLGPQMLAHVQAALTGQPSPNDGKYYGSEVAPGRAVGFVTLRVQSAGAARPDSLWGDYFWVDPEGDRAEGELLVDIDQGHVCKGLCDRHLVRFMEGGAFDGGTQLVIWTGKVSAPSPVPEPLYMPVELSGNAFYKESGVKFDERILNLMPTQVISLADLDLSELFGWIDVVSEEPVYVGVRYDADGRFAVAVQSWCLEEPAPPVHGRPRPEIDVEKLTAGADADFPPGPALEIATPVVWEYLVRNTGNVRLSGIVVSDNRGVTVTCPGTSLSPGGAMTCIANGVVQPGQYSNIGTVTGNPPTGSPVTDSDPSHYLGVQFIVGDPAIAIEKLTNGQDADTPPGPPIGQGSPVTWTYMVTNVGGVGLTSVSVADSDPSVVVSCPKTSLAIGESMICTGTGIAIEGQYSNTGVATGFGADQTVSDSDPSHYFGLPEIVTDLPAIAIEKLTNGFDADGVGSAPQLHHGHPVIWTYVVTNSGNVTLSNVTVTDDKGVLVSCPKTVLDPGEQMICTGSGTAMANDECYENVGTVIGTPPEGDNVTDSDPSHYCAAEVPGEAAIHIEKYTNGEDADVAPGPTLLEGDNVQWVYVVTNPGDVTLTGVMVTDDQGVTVTCPGGQPFILQPGEAMTCFANGLAAIGQYANVGTATGTPEGGGDSVNDSDPSHYLGEEIVEAPEIDLEKHTNGFDADSPPGPALTVGDPVLWTYLVTNTGNVALTGVTVTDDQGAVVICPKTTLLPGESMTCVASGVAEAGQYANIGTAEGDAGAITVSDTDPSHYLGSEPAGDEGCTPGYWKNHTDSWPPTGYATSQSVSSVFTAASAYPTQGSSTLLQALAFSGGPGVSGAVEILLRAAVAGLLNAAHPSVSYPLTPAQVLAGVNTALASNDRDTMLTLAASLDAGNNLGCPLN
jgi:hypothetical protein